jgi:hypothetical protein
MEKQLQPSENLGVDTLCVYGFAFDFPVNYGIEFDPKFKREEGSLALKSPSKSVIFVSWGDLRKVVKKLPTPVEHSQFSMERAAKSAQGRLTNIGQKEMKVNGHTAVFSHARVDVPRGFIPGRNRNQEIESLHLHCENASRYYVIYTSFDAERPKDSAHEDALMVVVGTFKCHLPEVSGKSRFCSEVPATPA